MADIEEIYDYITLNLSAKKAATKLITLIKNSTNILQVFPYMYPQINLLNIKYKIHRMVINSYLVFYIINEKSKEVHIIHILYSKRNYLNP